MLTQTAIKYFGTRTALAKALGIRAPSTYNWGETVPRARQYELERLTNGDLKADWPPKPDQRSQ